MLEAGKVSEQTLKNSIFPQSGAQRSEVIAGPSYGVDVSLVAINDSLAMALTSDPLSYIPYIGMEASAWLSVHLMVNDIITTTVKPSFLQLVLNLPEEVTAEAFEEYWSHIHSICQGLNISITGGHTGLIPGLVSTISGGGTLVSVGEKSEFLLSDRAEPGDLLYMSKHCAMSSSALLAMSFPEYIKRNCGKEVWEKASEQFYETSVFKEGVLASELNKTAPVVKAMHDVTEGGVYGAIYEMAVAANVGVRINDWQLPKSEITQKLCSAFDLDHRYCIGAGSMIFAVNPENKVVFEREMSTHMVRVTALGEFLEPEEGRSIKLSDGQLVKLKGGEKDPYWEAYFKAFTEGWK